MGRWDEDERGNDRYREDFGSKRRIGARGIRRIIYIGFAVLAVIMISFFASRAGLHISLHERGEAIGTVQVLTVQISNNSLETLRNATIQFGDKNPVQLVGDIGPFGSVLVSPEGDDFGFDRVTVTANDGAVNVVKMR